MRVPLPIGHSGDYRWSRRESNPHPSRARRGIFPLDDDPVRADGIEPSSPVSRTGALPLDDARTATVELGGIEPPSAECRSAILPLKYSPDGANRAERGEMLRAGCAREDAGVERKGGESNSQYGGAARTGSGRADLPMCEPFQSSVGGSGWTRTTVSAFSAQRFAM